MKASKIVMTGAAAVALVTAGTAAGAAVAGPVDGSGVIHGCYASQAINGSHVIKLQNAGTSCPHGTTAIFWNQRGPAGPAGAPGAPGPSTAGPAGLDLTVVSSSSQSDATAVCPSSHPYVVSGGGQDNNGQALWLTDPQVVPAGGGPGPLTGEEQPGNVYGWAVVPVNATDTVTAYAVCAK